MSDDERIDPTPALRLIVTSIEIPLGAAHGLGTPDDMRQAIAPVIDGSVVPMKPVAGDPRHGALRSWSPFRPFTGLRANYRLAREALRRNGTLGIVYVCVAAGLASVVWRHASLFIGIAGGLLVSGILFVRTGAYREYLAAIEEAQGVPPLGLVLRYNVERLWTRIRTLWRR